jgi:hypothetical protein
LTVRGGLDITEHEGGFLRMDDRKVKAKNQQAEKE